MSNKVEKIVLHCSDSEWATAMEINKWHIQRKFLEIGYHFVILNGKPTYSHYKSKHREKVLDGQIEIGRELNVDGFLQPNEYGAQVKGYNTKSIGICLIGKKQFTQNQITSSYELIIHLMSKFGLGVGGLVGHYELDKRKTCPNIDMNLYRSDLKIYIKRKVIEPKKEIKPTRADIFKRILNDIVLLIKGT